jgi:lysophospholipase L1-like esterase
MIRKKAFDIEVVKLFKNLTALLIGIIIVFFIIEGILRIYNPFEFRVRGDKIVLPVNKKYVIKNDRSQKKPTKFDDIIIHTKNSLGFRGEEPPADFSEHLTIITVGGSTTECTFLSDGKTWTDVLGGKLRNDFEKLWINNAGFDGQSTFGHIVLMEDYIIKLKPDVVLFLVGSNDVGLEDFGEYDKEFMKNKFMLHSAKWFVKSMANHSEVFSLGVNLYRHLQAQLIGVAHREIDFSFFLYKAGHSKLTKKEEEERQKKVVQINNNDYYLKSYKKRLEALVNISRENNIDPVFITQPTLYGDFIYDVGGIKFSHGKEIWEIQELYNNITRQVGIENGILVIDLAKEMPKNTKYYYDYYHFANEGAEKVAGIIYNNILNYISEKHSSYLRKLPSKKNKESIYE